MHSDWPFDQAENVAAITTKQVLNENYPILQVVHYSDDDSWAFICGTTSESTDGRVVGMGRIIQKDPTVKQIADLPPGWGAWREKVGGAWTRYRSDE